MGRRKRGAAVGGEWGAVRECWAGVVGGGGEGRQGEDFFCIGAARKPRVSFSFWRVEADPRGHESSEGRLQRAIFEK
jgi:hypothetical protein